MHHTLQSGFRIHNMFGILKYKIYLKSHLFFSYKNYVFLIKITYFNILNILKQLKNMYRKPCFIFKRFYSFFIGLQFRIFRKILKLIGDNKLSTYVCFLQLHYKHCFICKQYDLIKLLYIYINTPI